MHEKAVRESDLNFQQLHKTKVGLEKSKKNEKQGEKLVEGLTAALDRKTVLIKDFDEILEQLEPYATDEQVKKINALGILKEKVD